MINQRGITSSQSIALAAIVVLLIAAIVAIPKFMRNDNQAAKNNASPGDVPTVSCGTIKEPQSGSTVTSGSEVPVQFELTSNTWEAIELLSSVHTSINTSTGAGTLSIPKEYVGLLTVELVGVKGVKDAGTVKADGTMCEGKSITLNVRPNASVIELFVIPIKMTLESPGKTEQILVSARYSDGVDRSASEAIVGTTYQSLHPSIATVDKEGLVTGRTPGVTSITVQNGKLFKNVTVRVLEQQPSS